jgi:serine/threonine protein kinase
VPGSSTSTQGVKKVRRTVGRYEIVREIGRGGMATVYLARQIDLEREVALKELGALRAEDPSFVKRFLREAQLAGSLSHPNVVTVHDYFEHEGVPYIAMEYVEGGSVRPWVGRMSQAQIGGVLRDVLAGLGAAERQNIVHRDMKPENVMVTSEGRVKIADFGIAKATNRFQTGAFMTSTGVAVGTPNYIAPEQARAQEVGPWTDLYALGVMAFEFYVGKAPFADTEEPMAVLLRHVNERIPAVSELDPAVDPRISNWIEWLVSKNPSDRPQTAGEAWDAVEETLIASLGPQWARMAPLLEPGELPPEPPRPPSRPTPTTAHLSAARRTASERPTDRVGDPLLAATIPPTPRATPVDPPSQPSSAKPRWRPLLTGAVAAVAVIALIAAALSPSGGTGGGSQPAAGSGAASGASAADQTAAVRDLQTTTPSSAPSADKATLAKQVRTARQLGRQYESTAARIESLGSGSSSNAALVAALRQTARAYKAAGTAASAGDEAGYTASIAAAVDGKSAVEKVLDAGSSGTPATGNPTGTSTAPSQDSSGVGDSQSDDPSDDEPDGSSEP